MTLILLAAALPSARAASFDCTKAKAPDEVAVCKIPELSELDTKMGALWFTYRQIPFLMGASGARIDDAEAFLKKRGACGDDDACLRAAYESRIKALEAGIDDWLKGGAEAAAGPPQWSADTLPPAVMEIVDGYAAQCKQLDGTLAAGFDKPMIMTADMDGDSIQDFVLNPQNMQCSAAATAFCGNGGCNIRLVLSSNGYADPVSILGGAPSLSQNEEQGTLFDVWVDGSNCNITDAQSSCMERYSWRDGKLAVTHQIRQYQE